MWYGSDAFRLHKTPDACSFDLPFLDISHMESLERTEPTQPILDIYAEHCSMYAR